jgi:hypothetical protein
MPAGKMGETPSSACVERARAVEDAYAVEVFVPLPKMDFSRDPTSIMSSDAPLGCEIPGSLLDPCSVCSGLCSGAVFVYYDKVFCSAKCRREKKGHDKSGSAKRKLQRSPSNL